MKRWLIDTAARAGLIVVLAAGLGGCATAGDPAGKVQDKTESAFRDAARTPFSDLNVVRKDIPDVLKTAHKGPYAVPVDPTCEGIAREVEALDQVLGADLDTPASASNPSLIERGADALGDSAGGAIRGAVEGLIPYRSWIRRLSGAERYSREVVAAVAAGTVRRTYLKGIGQAQGCREPAAPRPAP
ncbi:MAG: hypothetical protein SF172_18605 [Burkholderiales bacterium]|nr:hypothetical protein [Burkholderiales bacterium]